MAKVDAKGRAEADFYFKLRAEESGKKARGPSKETIRRDREELFDASHGSSGIRFDEYEAVPVQRSGPGAEPRGPKALASFDDLADAKFAVPKFVLENVRRCGYKRPTPIQAHCLPLALDDKNDLMSCAQTGSGKTCAFLVPAISRLDPNAREGSSDKKGSLAASPSVVVMAPTRELAIQIHHEARRLAFDDEANAAVAPPRAVVVYGGADAKAQLRELARGCDVLVATPGRLTDFVDRGVVSLSNTKRLILDEADRMLDMGFEPQIKKILKLCPSARQTLMFTATWPEAVRKIAEQFTVDPTHVRIGDGGTRLTANTSITQTVEIIDEDSKLDRAIAVLKKNITDGARGIVFCGTKRRCDFLDRKIKACGLRSAGAVHGDKDQAEREYSLDLFRKGKAPLLVATDVAARGLDIKGVTHVVNFDMARDVESYVHRIGRTGRAGEVGESVTFWNPDYDIACSPALCKIARDAGQEVPEWLAKYEKGKESKQWKVADAVLKS